MAHKNPHKFLYKIPESDVIDASGSRLIQILLSITFSLSSNAFTYPNLVIISAKLKNESRS